MRLRSGKESTSIYRCRHTGNWHGLLKERKIASAIRVIANKKLKHKSIETSRARKRPGPKPKKIEIPDELLQSLGLAKRDVISIPRDDKFEISIGKSPSKRVKRGGRDENLSGCVCNCGFRHSDCLGPRVREEILKMINAHFDIRNIKVEKT